MFELYFYTSIINILKLEPAKSQTVLYYTVCEFVRY